MLVKSFAAAVYGIDSRLITVEVNIGGRIIPNTRHYFMVGLPDKATQEGTHRQQAAIKNSGYSYPQKKIIINLAPADIRKEGASFDLPIAVGLLGATEQINTAHFSEYLIVGELALDGKVRPVKGILPMAIQAKSSGFKGIIVPAQNAHEASLVDDLQVIAVETLKEAAMFIDTPQERKAYKRPEKQRTKSLPTVDFIDVKGQFKIKRAMEIAAAGGHNVILIGPPGSGKTMLARRLPTILPPLSWNETLETTKIHSIAGRLNGEAALIEERPFRSPHHTISDVALVGGGSNPNPGEISLAHHGVLFLDELPEFKRTVLEVLRQPMEERRVTISRARISVDYPANFMLVASMNPCPCGYYNHPEKECVCPAGAVKRYLSKISGPLMDRIDLHVEVTPVSYDELMSMDNSKERSVDISERVLKARKIQEERFKEVPEIYSNALMPGNVVRTICHLSEECRNLLKIAMDRLSLSARAHDRILKVARTIADLENAEVIEPHHLSEAIDYRTLDRENWAENYN